MRDLALGGKNALTLLAPEGSRMEWTELGPYRGYLIWGKQGEGASWVAAVTPIPGLSDRWVAGTPPSDEMILPEGFESKVAATEAAMRHIDREHQRRVQREVW